MLILAGAGTGKTRVIAHRIAYLLAQNPELSPSHLLALTFTKQAAEEMKRRVEALLGSYADDLNCFTFHGFCHRFLQDHALMLGLPSRFGLLDRVEGWLFMRRLLPELTLKVFWNLADPFAALEGFLRFMSRAKDELVQPEDYEAFGRGLVDPQAREAAQEIHRVYRIYQERKRQAGLLDFGDLIQETLRALKTHTPLLDEVRQAYRYILVDEFQDTNVAQIALVALMAGPGGNLCVVGDDDQAIYRFRGASFASFLLMKESFPQVRVLRLAQNYRSTPTILSRAARLIQHNEPDRFDPEKKIWTQNPLAGPVQVWVSSDEAHEASAARQVIESLYARQDSGERRYDRIAVLYRAHAHKDLLVKELQARGIPFHVRQGLELFETEEIQLLTAFLRVVRDPSDSVELFQILSHPVWGIPLDELLSVNRLAKEQKVSLMEMVRRPPAGLLSQPTARAVSQLLLELDLAALRGGAGDVGQLLPWAAEETFLKALFVPLGPRGMERHPLTALGKFLKLVYRYVENHPREKSLEAFLLYVEALEETQADPLADEEDDPGDRVRLMTVHQAKGLEFDWVILLSLIQGRFPSRARPEPIPFPTELMKERLPSGDHHLQEERRLCYVAATRAKQGLILMTQERAYHRSSQFVREMLEEAQPSEILKEAFPAVEPLSPAASAQRSSGHQVHREILEILSQIRQLAPKDESGYKRLLARMSQAASLLRTKEEPPAPPKPLTLPESFSFSQLETYRYCPAKYLYAYLYQIPVPPTPQMAFGLDLHACLEAFLRELIETSKVSSLEELIASFKRLHGPGRYGEGHQDEVYQDLGVKILTEFYKKHDGRWIKPHFVEKPFLLRLAGAAIRGVIDRVDPLPEGGVEIIDYKSGKPKEDATPQERMQLLLYALAVQEVFGLEPRKISFYYLQTNDKLSFEEVSPHLEATRGKILQLVQEIRSGDFTPNPSPAKCHWCDFKRLCPASLA